MARKIRNTAILAKIETTYGTDATPTGADDALLISNATFDYEYANVDRALIRPYFGGSEQLAGTRWAMLNFEVEIASSGAAGTAPAWGKLLQGCAMAETIFAASRVEYAPVSTALKSLTIYYYDDGVLHVALGCRGNVEVSMGEGERGVLRFSFVGLDGGVSATALPTLTLTDWQAPTVITDANSGDVKLGGTYATGSITGGTAYPSRGISLDLGNDVRRVALLGGQSADIADRAMRGAVQLELSAAQEVTMLADVAANTLTSLSFEHGTAAGASVVFYAPKVQRINPKHADFEGNLHMAFDLRLTPNAGNDELLIVAK